MPIFPTPLEVCATGRADLPESLAWLRRQLAGGLDAATQFLTLARDSQRLLALYRDFFPVEWAASNTPLFAPAHRCATYTAREAEFFELVDERVAPLFLDWLFECDEERGPFIPLRPLQDYDWLYDETDFAELPSGYQLALALNSPAPEVWTDFCELHRYDPPAQRSATVNGARLARLARLSRTPLRHLPVAVNLTCYNTGNPLLDWHPEGYEPALAWNAPNLRRLRVWRARAERTQANVARLSAWLDGEEQHEKLTLALRLWNLADLEYDTLLTAKGAERRAAEHETRRFARRINRYADQLQLFDAHP